MTFHEPGPEGDEELAEAIGESYEQALASAVDLSAAVKDELLKNKPDGLIAFINAQRAEAVKAVQTLADPMFDPANTQVVRSIQLEIALYQRAVAFAQNAVVGYMDGGLTSEDDESPSVD